MLLVSCSPALVLLSLRSQRYKALKRVDEKLVNIPPIMRMTDEDASRNVPQLYKLRDYLDLRRVPGMIW